MVLQYKKIYLVICAFVRIFISERIKFFNLLTISHMNDWSK